MSTVLDLIPIPWPRKAKHDPDTIIRRLRQDLDEATCKLIELTTENDQLEAQLDTAGIELSGAREDTRAAKQSIRHLEAIVHLRDREIDKLNERIRVGIGAEHVIAKTQEIDTREIQERFASGPVVSLHHAPQATADPGQTAWGARNEQQRRAS